jgi:hypothetical protein
LTKSIQPFKLVVKDRLFYNRFEYSIGFCIDEASCLRELGHEQIDDMIKRRIAWRELSQQRIAGKVTSSLLGHPHNILSRRSKDITEQTISDLHGLADLLLTTNSDYKLVVSVNNAHVYANDRKLIDQVGNLPGVTQRDYSQAVIGRPKNTIQLKNPRHAFRSYFKMTKITDEQKNNLKNFLNNQQESIRLSPALARWIAISFNRTQDYFFVDHNEMSWLTMLGLVRPGIIRKTMQIIPTK